MIPNLEIQVNKTNAGLWTVTYGYKEAPLDVQEAAFANNGLDTVSPAQLGFLRAKGGKGTFKLYSRTSADVFYDDRNDGQVVVIPNGAISRQFGVVDLVHAHRQDREYFIPKDRKERVYALVDKMLKNGFAFTAPDGQTQVPTSDFGKNDLTSRLFSDKSLGIEAQEYGDWLQSQGKSANTFFMDNKDYSQSQKAPYLNRLRVYSPVNDFYVYGFYRNLDLNLGAFGVCFEKAAEYGKLNSPVNLDQIAR